ncbi:MAG: helix-turn-helix transcriptional regulator [Abditibacteriota bacterium]|nr:helix-turn-helix transcriptional regulator [Abditibacteriota bacterium]
MRKKENMKSTNNKKDQVFAERLRLLMDAQPYDRRDLSRRLGVPISTIMKWEDGEAVPDVIRLRCVAMYFGLPCEFFLEVSVSVPEKRTEEDPLRNWQIADRLGLSECTVEKLEELAESAPGEALDKLDDAIFSMAEAVLAARDDWDTD